MMFATVGTTKFDALIQEIDRLAESGFFKEKIICQIGSGDYIPKHCKYFRFKPNIDEHLESANLVITHGGSTVLHMLGQKRRFVAIANISLADDHQTHYLKHLEKHSVIFWSRDPNQLGPLVSSALSSKPAKLTTPSLPDKISKIIEEI